MSEHHAKAHSTFGGSSADRWMNCAGSTALIASANLPETTSAYAAEGTAAHALAEECLKTNTVTTGHFIGEEFDYDDHGEQKTITVSKDMADAVQVYLDAVHEELLLAPDSELYVEQKFILPIATAEEGEVFGANDALVYIPSLKRLTVFDYKHGAGISVSAEDSAQLKFYASGAALSHPDWRVTQVDLVIVQPRSRDAEENDGGVKRWSLDPIQLVEFAAEAEVAIRKAKGFTGLWDHGSFDLRNADDSREDEHGVVQAFNAGKWCKWCKAAAICPARERNALRAAALDFNDITLVTPRSLPEPKSLDTARLGQVLSALDIIEEWGKQVRDQVNSLVVNGVPVPGWKAVEKVGRRKWIDDETKIADYLELMHGVDPDDSRPRKLVTITEAERLVKAQVADKTKRKAALDDMSLAFTLKESSGLTLVRDSDKREAVDAVARDFGSVQL